MALTTTFDQAACDFVCSQLSPILFDLALDIVFKQVTTSIRSNSARVVSQLTSCFARADSAKTLRKFFSICSMNIRLEIEQGASSVRTTSTNTPIESDVTLHWWIGLLTGSITNAGAEVSSGCPRGCDPSKLTLPLSQLLNYRADMLSLVKFMVENCKSERGYTTTGRILGLLLISLTNVSVKDYRSVNKDEWNGEGGFPYLALHVRQRRLSRRPSQRGRSATTSSGVGSTRPRTSRYVYRFRREISQTLNRLSTGRVAHPQPHRDRLRARAFARDHRPRARHDRGAPPRADVASDPHVGERLLPVLQHHPIGALRHPKPHVDAATGVPRTGRQRRRVRCPP